jgi:hypothetical protein
MRYWQLALLITIVTLPASGCQTLLAIDQWKCDNLGCCMPWVKPSNSCGQPPAACNPQSNYAVPGIVTGP